MELLTSQLLNGIAYGTLLFLLAAGLSLIFGLMNVVSLAHGSFFMLGAVIGFTIVKITGNYWLALLLAPLPVVALGVAIERLFLRRLYARGHLDQVLLTFGFTFVFADLVKWIWGADIKSLAIPASLQGMVGLLGTVFPVYRLFLIGFGVALAIALWLFLERTRVGTMIRAGVDDSAMANGLGINVSLLFTSIFALGAGLAALAGVAAGPMVGIYSGMDVDIMVPAFIVIVVGGMGSLRGAFVGSMVIGIADTMGKALFPDAALFLVYLLMVVVLLSRPQGLFGLQRAG
jgi:branched-subunit amino acid ABC-type transport system permease component